ncbi:hypothetical protein N7537_007524 [Penicillium hordei]|uniref:Uncharacterized protein n=1 Tax=Penicillium hordei TaxID=40994 RepID=A0AAD6GXJ7_9EURO|nr:uncharacterized protein N7537_007524 [Penicillium hordei]KAJ5597440.1 hypothetical protein N7537_007524 [Penicillium hordei]
MNENLNYSAANGIWHGELLDSPICHNCLQLHDHHACPTLSKPKPLLEDSADALSLPPRSIKSRITGALSLHDYHKFLSKSADRITDPVDHAGRKLKRKTAALHLNRPSPLTISYPVSISSVASSPPPLSPSYSHSIISHWSEEPEIGEAQTVHYQATQSPRLPVVSDLGTRARPNRKRVSKNTFREKLQQRAQAQAEEAEAAKPQPSDSMLASTQAVATVSHGGACFEILNPRKSLDLARIVSYIEDVDNCSLVSTDNQRDSTFSIEQGLDRVSLSQFTDASLPSFYSTNSLYNSLPAEPQTPKGQTDIPSSSPGIGERIRSLSDCSVNDQGFNYWSRPAQRNENNALRIETYDHANNDREVPQSPRMASIAEESSLPNLDFSRRPSTPSTQTFYSESEIGEPGSPVYANGDWAQVDGRDRGILFDLPEDDLQEDETTSDHQHPGYPYSQHEEPPTPRETPLETPSGSPMHSPMYSTFDSAYPYPSSVSTSKLPHYPAPFDPYTYDPVYFDPHVQSVLAAANAETMGLRGSPARALDELQRQGRRSGETSPRFEFQRRKSDERKAQRKGLRKFFSWKLGN